jgi:curved DNA-binding protein CbpA
MSDLYEQLGVPKNATGKDLKKAYRDKSRETHPDHGGNEEDFKQLVRAYKILENPDTRKRYDNGEDPDKMTSGGTQADEVTLCVIGLYVDVVEQIDVDNTDVIQTMLNHLKSNHHVLDQEIAKCKARIKRYDSAMKRTNRDSGNNLLADMMKNRIADVEREIAEFERQKEIRKKAREMVNEYKYAADKADPSKRYGGFSLGIDMSGNPFR